MNSELEQKIREFADDYLVRQYTVHRAEYTDEALEIMKKEIASRNISDTAPEKAPEQPERQEYVREDFVPFEHSFSHIDLLLAQSALRTHGIPFFVDIPVSSSVLPLESQMNQRYTIHVVKERHDEARSVFEEHFDVTNNGYGRKELSPKERLRSFSFNEISLDEKQHKEEIDVSFSAEEKDLIVAYARRLLDEADAIEQKLDRMLFYYDSLEDLINALTAKSAPRLTRQHLLSTLEVLQVYCEEPDFAPQLESVAEGILNFISCEQDEA